MKRAPLTDVEREAVAVVERLLRARQIVSISFVNESDEYDCSGAVELTTFEGDDADWDHVPLEHIQHDKLADAINHLPDVET
jgi:hypothetical protein